MVSSRLLVTAYVLAGLLPLFFLPAIYRNRETAGANGLFVVVVTASLHTFASALGAAMSQDVYGFVSINLVVLAASVGPVGYLILVGEYTGTVDPTPRVIGLLAVEPVITQLLGWTNELGHHLIYRSNADFSTFEKISSSYVDFFWVHTVIAYSVLGVGVGLAVREAVRSQGVRRKQSLALAGAALPPGIAAGISTLSGGIAFSMTPFGLLGMTVILSWTLFQDQFLDIVPVARRTAIEEIDDAMVTVDTDDRVIDANAAALALFDVETEYVGMDLTDFFSSIPRAVSMQLADTVDVETEVSATIDGQTRHFSLSVSPVREEGKHGRVFLFREITAQKHRERQLESYESLFEESSDCIVKTEFVDGEPIVRSVNSAFEETFGYPEQKLLGRSLDESIVPEEYMEEARQLNHKEQSDGKINTEVTRQTTDGRREFLLRTAHFEDDVSYSIYTDITERKEREKQLKQTKAKLERSNEQLRRQNERLDQFASVVSHDLRNPLTAAKLQFGLIRDEATEEHAKAVEQNLDRMEAMIDDLLTLARSGQIVEETETVNLAETAQTAWENADVPNCRLELDVSDTRTVEADRDRLLHVFENLFRNASDHNDEPLTVRVGTPADSGVTDGGRSPDLFIEDDGDGIPESKRDEIFEHGYTTGDDGTGFGLSIVEEIVEAHGWEIEVTTGSDGGARFEIAFDS